jgi:hypothetical protein
MKLSESQFIWPNIWVCSLVLQDLNEAILISIHLTKDLSLFTCSRGIIWSFLNLNSFDQIFEFVHLFTCSLVHLITCSLVLKDLNEAIRISIHLTKDLSLFTCSLVFEELYEAFWNSIHLTKYLSLFTCSHVHLFSRIWVCSLVHLYSRNYMKLSETQFIWPNIWVCSLVHMFTCSRGFEWSY